MDYLGHQDYLVHQLQAGVSDRLDTTNANLAATNANLATTNANLEITNATLANVDSRVSSIENLTTDVNERIDAIDGRVDSIDTKVDNVDTKITNVDLKVDALADNVYTKSQVEGIEDNLLTQLGNLNTDVSGVRSLITNTKTEVNKKIDDHIGNITTSGADAHFTTGEKKKFSDLLTDIKSYAKTDALNNYYTKVEIEDYLHDNYLMTIPDEYVTESELNVALGNQLNSDDVAGSYYNKSEIDDYFSSYATTAWATSLINQSLTDRLVNYVTINTYNILYTALNDAITAFSDYITSNDKEVDDLKSNKLELSSIVYTPTVTSSTGGLYRIGQLKVKDNVITLYGKDTHTGLTQADLDAAIAGIEIPEIPEFPEPVIPDDRRTNRCVIYAICDSRPDKPTGGSYRFDTKTLDVSRISALSIGGNTQTVGSTTINGTTIQTNKWITTYIEPTVTMRVWTTSAMFVESLDGGVTATNESESDVTWDEPTEIVNPNVVLQRVPISSSFGVSVYTKYNGEYGISTPTGGRYSLLLHTLIEAPVSGLYDKSIGENDQDVNRRYEQEWSFFPIIGNGTSCSNIQYVDTDGSFSKTWSNSDIDNSITFRFIDYGDRYSYTSADGTFKMSGDGCTVIYDNSIPEYKKGILVGESNEIWLLLVNDNLLNSSDWMLDGILFTALESRTLGDKYAIARESGSTTLYKEVLVENAVAGLNLVRYQISSPYIVHENNIYVAEELFIIVGNIKVLFYSLSVDNTPKWYNTIDAIPNDGPIWVSYNNYIATTNPVTNVTTVDQNGTGWTIPVKYIDIDGALEKVHADALKTYEEIATATKQELLSYSNNTKKVYENAAKLYEEAKAAFESVEVGDISAIGIQQQISQLRGEIHTKGWNIGVTTTAYTSSYLGNASTPYFKCLIGNIQAATNGTNWTTIASNVNMNSFTLTVDGRTTLCYYDISDEQNVNNSSLKTVPIRTANGSYVQYKSGAFSSYYAVDSDVAKVRFVPTSGYSMSRPDGTTGNNYYNGDIFATSIDGKDIYYAIEQVANRQLLFSFRVTDAGGHETDNEEYLGRDGKNALVVVDKDSTNRLYFVGSIKNNGNYSYVETLFDAINTKYGITAMKTQLAETSNKINNATFEVDPELIKSQVTETFNDLSSSYVKQSTLTQTANLIRTDVYSDYGNIINASYIDQTSTGLVLKALSGSESDTLYWLDMSDINNADVNFIELNTTAIKINHVYIDENYKDVSFLCHLTTKYGSSEDLGLSIIAGSYKRNNADKDISGFYIWWNNTISSPRLEVYKPAEKNPTYMPLVLDHAESDWKPDSSFTKDGVTYTDVKLLLDIDCPIIIKRFHNTLYDTLKASVINMTDSEVSMSLTAVEGEKSQLTGNKIKGATTGLKLVYSKDGKQVTDTMAYTSAGTIVLDGATIASSIAAKELNIDNVIYLFGYGDDEKSTISEAKTTTVTEKQKDSSGKDIDVTVATTTYTTKNYSAKDDTYNSLNIGPKAGTAWFAAGKEGMTIFNADGSGQLAGGLVKWGKNVITTSSVDTNENKVAKSDPLSQFGVKVEGIIEAYAGKLGTSEKGYWTITDSDIISPGAKIPNIKSQHKAYNKDCYIRLDAAGGSISSGTLDNQWTAWQLNRDGSGQLSNKQIEWDAEGKLQIHADMDVTAKITADSLIGTFVGIGDRTSINLDENGNEEIVKATETVNEKTTHIGVGEAVAEKYGLGAWFNLDGSGSLARGKIWWDKYGNTNIVAKGYVSSPVVEVTVDKLKTLAGDVALCHYYAIDLGTTYVTLYNPNKNITSFFNHYHDFKSLAMHESICRTIITTNNGGEINSAFVPTTLTENADGNVSSVERWRSTIPYNQNTANNGKLLAEYLDLSALSGVYLIDFYKLFGSSAGALTIVLPSIEHEDRYQKLSFKYDESAGYKFSDASDAEVINGNCWQPTIMCYVAGEPESNLDQVVGNIITFQISNSSGVSTETCLRLVGIFDSATGPIDNYMNVDKLVTYVRGFMEIPNNGYIKLQCCSRLRKSTTRDNRIAYDYYWHVLSAGDNDASANKFTCGTDAVLRKLYPTYK